MGVHFANHHFWYHKCQNWQGLADVWDDFLGYSMDLENCSRLESPNHLPGRWAVGLCCRSKWDWAELITTSWMRRIFSLTKRNTRRFRFVSAFLVSVSCFGFSWERVRGCFFLLIVIVFLNMVFQEDGYCYNLYILSKHHHVFSFEVKFRCPILFPKQKYCVPRFVQVDS